MLPLHRQEHYRRRYGRRHPTWQPATAVYEQLVQRYLAAATGPYHLRVLDVGCGAGGVLERLARQITQPVGIDRELESLQRHRAPIALLCGDTTALPFPSATFDLLLSSWVFEHLPDPTAALGEMARVLKPQGHLVFLTPHATHWLLRVNRWVPAVAQSRLVRLVYGRTAADTFPVRYTLNTRASITRVAKVAGLYPVALQSIPDPTYVAFNEAGFWLGMLLERLLAPGDGIHLVGDLVKQGV